MFQKISYIMAMFITVSSFQLSIQAAEKQPLSEKERIQQNKPLSETYQELINLSTDNDFNTKIIEEYSKGEFWEVTRIFWMQKGIDNYTMGRWDRPVREVLLERLQYEYFSPGCGISAGEKPIFAELFTKNLPFILATAQYFGGGVISQFDRSKVNSIFRRKKSTKLMFTPGMCYWEDIVENGVLQTASDMKGMTIPFYRLLSIVLDIVDEKIKSGTATTPMFMRNYNLFKETLVKNTLF